MDYTHQSPVILSLCTGYGGLEQGLEAAFQTLGWQLPAVAAYVEIEAFCIANLVAKMETGRLVPAPVCTDVAAFAKVAHHFCGKIHGITGGYPCQPFSIAGKRKGEADPRHLWPHIRTIIEAVKPVWCFFENVDDHLNLGFDRVYADMEHLGYATEAGIYSAAEAGATHTRQRLFFLAIKVGHTHHRRSQQHNQKQRNTKLAGKRCTEMEHPHFLRRQHAEKQPEQFGTHQNGQLPPANKGRHHQQCRAGKSGAKVAHTTEWGRKTKWHTTTQQTDNAYTDGKNWPAPPGRQQHHWEAPRTVESDMGVTVDGYNFREDLLRALGNGVVPATAQLAFIHLLQKHGVI